MNAIRLIVEEGMRDMSFPSGGGANGSEPSLLMRFYSAGDMDTIPWPMVSEFASELELRQRLAMALYDERESNSAFPNDAVIELPDGSRFDFDMVLCEMESAS